jgi:hypothetical protein
MNRLLTAAETFASGMSSRKHHGLFILILLCEIAVFLSLILGHRLPRGHDILAHFPPQFYFLNNAVTAGEIPQWVPFITHGTLITWWWYITQAGILQNILIFMPGFFLKSFNFIQIYYLGFLVDSLLLLVGTWRLTERYFPSTSARAFVTLAVMGSCIWIDQPWFSFHFYYAIPLILVFVHSFFEKKQWRYFFAAGNLLAFQALGNLPYLPAITALAVFLYFAFYFTLRPKSLRHNLRDLCWNKSALAAVLGVILTFAVLAGALRLSGGAEMSLHRYGRDPNSGKVTLIGFLYNRLNPNIAFASDLLTGVSPCVDQTYYVGLLTLFFLLLGLVSHFKNRDFVLWMSLGVIFFLFSMGTAVASFFYYFWPGMKYVRYIYMVLPISKLFFGFAAGYGFESLANRKRLSLPVFLWGVLLLATFAAFFAGTFPASAWGAKWQSWLTPAQKDYCAYTMPSCEPGTLLLRYGASGFILLTAFLALWSARLKRHRAAAGLALILLLLQAADLYAHKEVEFIRRTRALRPDQYRLFRFQPIPFEKRRTLYFMDNNPRAQALFHDAYVNFLIEERLFKEYPSPEVKKLIGHFETLFFPRISYYGSEFATLNLMIFKDQLGSTFSIDYWLTPFDKLLRAFDKIPLEEEVQVLRSQIDGGIMPPLADSFLKITGSSEDKIQFFSKAYPAASEKTAAAWLTDNRCQADSLILIGPQASVTGKVTAPLAFQDSLPAPDHSDRLHLPYEVKRFDANHFEITVELKDRDNAWLYYCDVWHPGWKVTVNNRPSPIFRANLAYKAVAIQRGKNLVRFHFNLPGFTWLQAVFALNSVFWLFFLLSETFKLSGVNLRALAAGQPHKP